MIQHLTYHYEIPEKEADVLNSFFDMQDIVIFDIETTGLSPAKHPVILIGFITFEDGISMIHQLFAEHIRDEKEILEAFIKLASHKKIFVNFNGSSFDIPYLNKRFEHFNFSYRIHSGQSFDLYRICKASKLEVPNYKLKTLETYLGIQREDTISGRESIQLYYDYMNNGNTRAKDLVLGHNYEDILHLIPFMRILTHVDPQVIAKHLPHRINLEQMHFYMTHWAIKNDFLNLTFSISNPAQFKSKELSYYAAFSLNLSHGELKIQLPIFKILMPDSTLYVFIDCETLGWVPDFNTLDYNQKLQYLVCENNAYAFERILSLTKYLLKHLNDI